MAAQRGDFVGRQRELEAIWRVIHLQEPYRVMFVVAAAGLGKTRLLSEVRDQCRETKHDHVWCDLAETDKDLPYFDIAQTISDELGPEDFDLFQDAFEDIADDRTQRKESVTGLAQQLIDEIEGLLAKSPGGAHVSQSLINSAARNVVGGNLVEISRLVLEMRPNPYTERWVQDLVTATLQDCLAKASARREIVLLFDHWDRAEATADRLWLRKSVIDWISENKLDKATIVIASRDGREVPPRGRYLDILNLPPLSDQEVAEYWVERHGLAAAHAGQAFMASKGRPFALEILARCKQGNPAPEFWDEGTLDCLFTWIAQANPRAEPVIDAARQGAIPARLERSLLDEFAEPHVEDDIWDELTDLLADWSLATQEGRESFRYDPGARRTLLKWWRVNRAPDYKQANHNLYAHFLKEAGDVHQADSERLECNREAIYHRLFTNTPDGLNLLRIHFDAACEGFDAEEMGEIERLVGRQELRDWLDNQDQPWLDYYQARAALFHGETRASAALMELTESPSDAVRAAARWSLGELHADQRRWLEAVDYFNSSLNVAQAAYYRARAQQSLGLAYNNMAEQHGSTAVEGGELLGFTIPLFVKIQQLPFLAYKWLVRRYRRVPSWFLNTNYQDWVMAALCTKAADCFRQAKREFEKSGESEGATQADLWIARLEHLLGHWMWARRCYEVLEESGRLSHYSDYRRAQIRLSEGRTYLDERKLDLAQARLQAALDTFRHLKQGQSDDRSIAIAAALLGRCHALRGEADQAGAMLLESVRRFDQAGHLLERTQVVWELEKVAAKVSRPLEIQEYLNGVTEREYVTRFPGELLGKFRRRALGCALPLACLLAVGLSLGLLAAVVVLESDLGLIHVPLTPTDAVRHVLVALLPLLVSLWLYRLVYTVVGVLTVRGIGEKRLKLVEESLPHRIVTNDEGIHFYKHGGPPPHTLRWAEITQHISVAILRRTQPIRLLSGLVLAADVGDPVEIDHMTLGFEHLRTDLESHLRAQGRVIAHTAKFVIFDWVAALAALAVSLSYALFLVLTGIMTSYTEVYENGQPPVRVETPVSGVMCVLLPTLLVTLAVATVWRAAFYQRTARQAAWRSIFRWPSPQFFWRLAILISVAAAAWLLGLPAALRLIPVDGP